MALEKNQEFLQAFGTRIKQLRQAKGLSMRALADAMNIDVNQISWIERAKTNTSIMMAYSLAKVLEVPLPELFTFEVKSGD
jgi:transcriptional regulator with XRE-family HTH domain